MPCTTGRTSNPLAAHISANRVSACCWSSFRFSALSSDAGCPSCRSVMACSLLFSPVRPGLCLIFLQLSLHKEGNGRNLLRPYLSPLPKLGEEPGGGLVGGGVFPLY